MTMTTGQEALAKVIRRIRANEGSIQGADGAAIAAWPEFKRAVAAALSELDVEELKGLTRWQDARHADNGGGQINF